MCLTSTLASHPSLAPGKLYVKLRRPFSSSDADTGMNFKALLRQDETGKTVELSRSGVGMSRLEVYGSRLETDPECSR